VIVFRLRNARAGNVIARLATVLIGAREDLTAGAVVTVEESRYRIRALPVGRETA